MNGKYLSGLLAGVLTTGAVQGSGNEGKMPGLGEKQTHVVQQQGIGNPTMQQMARFLAENSYRNGNVALAEDILNSVGLNGRQIIAEWENAAISRARTEENKGKRYKKSKLDPYHMQIVQQHMGYNTKNKAGKSVTKEDLMNTIQVNSDFEFLLDRNRINTIPVTAKNEKLFPNLNTQQIFGPEDKMLEDVDKYIFKYPMPYDRYSMLYDKGSKENNYCVLNEKYPNSVFEEVIHDFGLLDLDTCNKILETKNIKFFNLSDKMRRSFPIEWFSLLKIKFLESLINVSSPGLDVFCTWEATISLISSDYKLKSFYGCNLKQASHLSWSIQKIYLPFLSKIGESNEVYLTNDTEEVWVPYSLDLNTFHESARPKIRQYTAGQINAIQKERTEFFKYVKDCELENLLPYVNYTEKPEKLDKSTWRKVLGLKPKVEKLKAAMRGEVSPNDGSVLARLENLDPAYTLRDVRGDGNCGIYAVLQALHPEQNYLNVQANDERWNAAQTLRNMLPAGHPGREMAQNASDRVRWIEDQDFQYLAQHLGRSILFISERGQFIEYNRNSYMHVYNSLEEAFQQKAQGAIIIYHNGVDHFQTVVPMPKA